MTDVVLKAVTGEEVESPLLINVTGICGTGKTDLLRALGAQYKCFYDDFDKETLTELNSDFISTEMCSLRQMFWISCYEYRMKQLRDEMFDIAIVNRCGLDSLIFTQTLFERGCLSKLEHKILARAAASWTPKPDFVVILVDLIDTAMKKNSLRPVEFSDPADLDRTLLVRNAQVHLAFYQYYCNTVETAPGVFVFRVNGLTLSEREEIFKCFLNWIKHDRFGSQSGFSGHIEPLTEYISREGLTFP